MRNLFDEIDEKFVLPVLDENCRDDFAVEIYGRFMRHLRHVPNSRLEIKMLSAIQFTADFLGASDAQVSKTLVEMGLRAPRLAFPADFLRFSDASLSRDDWEVGAPSQAVKALKLHWDMIGEDKFVAFRGDYPVISEGVYA